ncbi:hypothetical protein HW132_05980 [Brasilonema sp. CT11]|nr:hypothetical protein [Brasilonema sp. CT11]
MSLRAERSEAKQSQGFAIASLRMPFGYATLTLRTLNILLNVDLRR